MGPLRGGVKVVHLRGCSFRGSERVAGVFQVEVYAAVRQYVLLEVAQPAVSDGECVPTEPRNL